MNFLDMAVVAGYTGYIVLDNFLLHHYIYSAVEVGLLDYPIDLASDYYMDLDLHTYFEDVGVLEVHRPHIAHFRHYRLEHPIAVFSGHMGQRTSFLRLVEQN